MSFEGRPLNTRRGVHEIFLPNLSFPSKLIPMKSFLPRAIALLLGLISSGLVEVANGEPSASADAKLVVERGTLLFEDQFERDEAIPDKEDIGGGWTTNSKWRAAGRKQVDLADGAMVVTRVPEADHGVAIFHDVAFRDGAVKLRFKLAEGESFAVDFVDREYKAVHAGHLCMARVTPKNVIIQDSKTGVMDNKIRERRLAGDKSPDLTKLIRSKSKTLPHPTATGQWHDLLIVIEGFAMRVTIDGEKVGEFRSEGMAHPTKRMITLAVNKGATFDNIKVWALK